MNQNRRIQEFLLKPLAVDINIALNQWFSYMSEIELAEKGNGTFLREMWANKQKASEPKTISFLGHKTSDGLKTDRNNSIAIINLRGAMRSNDGLSSKGIDYTCECFDDVLSNPNIKGAFLRTSSGGGDVEAANRLYSKIKEVESTKPVIQLIDGLSASGAVLAGSAATERIAIGKMAETGSVGVVYQIPKEYIEYLQNDLISVYATQSGEKHEVMRALMDKDYGFIRESALNPFALEFQKTLKKEIKGISPDAMRGRMFIAPQALKLGLIDSIGTNKQALDRMRTLIKERNRNTAARKAASSINFN